MFGLPPHGVIAIDPLDAGFHAILPDVKVRVTGLLPLRAS
jgi:hypothetical protein